jgi:hypothetical protein
MGELIAGTQNNVCNDPVISSGYTAFSGKLIMNSEECGSNRSWPNFIYDLQSLHLPQERASDWRGVPGPGFELETSKIGSINFTHRTTTFCDRKGYSGEQSYYTNPVAVWVKWGMHYRRSTDPDLKVRCHRYGGGILINTS